MRDSVVLDNVRIINGDVGRLLFEIGHGVTTLLQRPVDQCISLPHRHFGLVYKTCLQVAPLGCVTAANFRAKRLDVQLADALLALVQYRLGFARFAARLVDRAVVFGAELVSEPAGSLAPGDHPYSDSDCKDDSDEDDHRSIAHEMPP